MVWIENGIERLDELSTPAQIPVVIFCNPDTQRIRLLQKDLHQCGFRNVQLVSYLSIIEEAGRLEEQIPKGAIVRLESPGKDFAVERGLLRLGEQEALSETGYAIPQDRFPNFAPEKGEIMAPRQWYHGWCTLLNVIRERLQHSQSHVLMNSIDDVITMFDKPGCQRSLLEADVSIPPFFGTISSFEELIELQRATHCRRFFLKIANGSSASGVVAYQSDGGNRVKLTGALDIEKRGSELRLFNSRKIRNYTDLREVRDIIDALGKHVLHVERWIPKASISGKVFDLRVLMIGGKVQHTVARLSRSPITNLHLLNQRREFSEVRAYLPDSLWQTIVRNCERTMDTVFSASLHAGLDVLVSSDFRSCAITEVNAFGDQLNGIHHGGKTTYALEMETVLRSLPG